MKCASVRKLLPLHVGGELDPGREGEVEGHLRACAACAADAAGYRDAREWTRSYAPPPFSAADYDRVRREVWSRIDTEPRPAAWRELGGRLVEARLALAGATALLVVAAAWGLLGGRSSAPVAPPAASLPLEPLDASAPAVGPGVPEPRGTPTAEVREPSAATPPRRMARPVPVRRPAATVPAPTFRTPEAPSPGRAAELMRIEFQTEDPTIRIIWFAPKS